MRCRWVEPGAVRVVLELGHGKDRRTFEQQAVVVPGSPLEVVFAYPRQE